MKNIRHNVFETNSSSVHSITFDRKSTNNLRVSKDGYVHIKPIYFGKDFCIYSTSKDKLIYLLLTIGYIHNIWFYWDYDYTEDKTGLKEAKEEWESHVSDLRETTEFQLVENVVINQLTTDKTSCKGIKIELGDGGIDHQSQKYDSLDEFLSDNDLCNVHDFIFGNAVLLTNCD